MPALTEQEEAIRGMTNIFRIYAASQGQIRPHFFVTGPSGCGKTHSVIELCEQFNVDFVEINAAGLTKEGTAGNSLSKSLSALRGRTGALTVVFVDEFDKLFISGNSNGQLAHEVTNGVQNEFLKVLESNFASVYSEYGKYEDVDVSSCLFIFAGAFNGELNITVDRLRSFGIKTEFLGRVGLLYNMPPLSINSLYQALEVSPLLEKYLRLFPQTDRAQCVNTIMTVVSERHNNNTLGVRLLNTLINQFFINGGKLDAQQVQTSTFNTTLNFEVTQ